MAHIRCMNCGTVEVLCSEDPKPSPACPECGARPGIPAMTMHEEALRLLPWMRAATDMMLPGEWLLSAGDHTSAALAAAYVNEERVNRAEWCRCPGDSLAEGEAAYYCDPESGRHGWACTKCGKVAQSG